MLVACVLASDLAPVEPRATSASVMLPGATQRASLRDGRFEPTVASCSLQPSTPVRGGDECSTSLVDRHGAISSGRPLAMKVAKRSTIR